MEPKTNKIDAVWAEEAGTMLKAERINSGQVNVSIIEDDGRVLARATLGNWRWNRIVKAMQEETEASEAPSAE